MRDKLDTFSARLVISTTNTLEEVNIQLAKVKMNEDNVKISLENRCLFVASNCPQLRCREEFIHPITRLCKKHYAYALKRKLIENDGQYTNISNASNDRSKMVSIIFIF